MKGEGGNSIPKGTAAGRSVRAKKDWMERARTCGSTWAGAAVCSPGSTCVWKRDLEWGRQEEPREEAEVAGTRVGPWRRQGPWISTKWTRGLDKTVVSVPSALG